MPADEEMRLGTAKPSSGMNPRPKSQEDELSQTFEVLGMISNNKELFLFEKPVHMIESVEKWLI
jgi:hypothetical protein